MFRPAEKLSAPPLNDAAPEGGKLLLIEVICQAVEDRGAPTWRNDVDAFFSGPAFARYCGLLGWDEDWARRRIGRLPAPRRPARERATRGAQYES
jgi:hypothetical protein